ncbi:MAG: alpha-E domain-containing protein [Thiohalophilus sp.]|uniref:alpha-E domain-containing protein n=1 Tax=Thiohalophilus sp. TaxID=3028392 RepID=UPI00286FD04B|nr:alpha-E domain-containing protein [Thiohalophilus sp.]MDR9435873.1 alpha-E domain-containing protein [Thiohalophilus sp.]
MMLSRVANNIYWAARYIERAENTARLINVNSHLLLDLPKRVRLGWEPIIDILGNHELFYQRHDAADERQVVRFMVSEQANPGSIISSLRQARENARTIRDIIPREAWEQINHNYLQARELAGSSLGRRKRDDFLRQIILGAQTMTGMLAGTMTHDEGYDFLRMGRNLERADMTTRIVDVRSASLLPEMSEDLSPFENIQWVSVLKSLTAYQMYRREMRIRVRRPDVLRFLLQERRFPRALYHTICEVENCLQHLPHNDKPLKTLTALQKKVLSAKPEKLMQEELHSFVDTLQLGLAKLHQDISASYF